MNWETMGQIVAVASGISAAFHFAVLRPLDCAIKRIEHMLDKMDERFAKEEAARHDVEIHLAEVDQRARSAHNRLDEITKILAAQNNRVA